MPDPPSPRRAITRPAAVPAPLVGEAGGDHRETIELVAAAVEKARAVRGTVMLESVEDERHWCAPSAAADGRLELAVGEPPSRWLRQSEGERWLERHGFVHRVDAWALPVVAGASADACARTLVAALADALGWDGAPLRERLVHPGFAGADPPPPGAPNEAHLAAALRALLDAPRARVHVEGGVPAIPWAWVWPEHDDGTFAIVRDVRGGDEEQWRVPLTADGAEAGARELARRIAGDYPDFEAAPLFIGLPDLD